MPLGRRLKVTPLEAVEMYREHKTTKKVAEILGVSPTTVSAAIRKWEERTGDRILPGRGRHPIFDRPMTSTESSARSRCRRYEILVEQNTDPIE